MGAAPLLDLGLGDDQHTSGYEAGLDAWTSSMWPHVRAAAGPLPPGAVPPVLSEALQLELGQPKFSITLLPPLDAPSSEAGAQGGVDEERAWQSAVRAFASFRHLSLVAAGVQAPLVISDGCQPRGHSALHPFLAPLCVNRRLTAASHFQDTRHIELGVDGSGLRYEPGGRAA